MMLTTTPGCFVAYVFVGAVTAIGYCIDGQINAVGVLFTIALFGMGCSLGNEEINAGEAHKAVITSRGVACQVAPGWREPAPESQLLRSSPPSRVAGQGRETRSVGPEDAGPERYCKYCELPIEDVGDEERCPLKPTSHSSLPVQEKP